jgi:intracellular septation protein
MEKPSSQKPFFLLSFLPAFAYWLLETYTSLEVALIGGIILGLMEMALEKYFTGHVHTISKVNLVLILILGGISLIAQEGVWFKLQPTFTGLGFSAFLIYQKIKGNSLMMNMLKDMGQLPPLPESIYKIIEWHMSLFLIGFALFMAKVAVYDSTATWLFWKSIGFYIAFGAFMILEMLYLRFQFRRKS